MVLAALLDFARINQSHRGGAADRSAGHRRGGPAWVHIWYSICHRDFDWCSSDRGLVVSGLRLAQLPDPGGVLPGKHRLHT
jgi:hypothetical protein